MKKYTNNNKKFDEVDKILNDYTTFHNKKFYFYFINCKFVIEFDNSFAIKIETTSFYNTDISNLMSSLLYSFDCFYQEDIMFITSTT